MQKGFYKIVLLIICILMVTAGYAGCTFSTTTPLAFPDYFPFSSTRDDTIATVTLNCSSLLAILTFSVSINGGSYGTVALRKMANGSGRINYNVFTDLARTRIWGDGTFGTFTQAGACIIVLGACTVPINIYGSIPALQNVITGGYADSLTVTLTY